NRVIESGPSVDSRLISPSRVVSPSAANTGAAWGAAMARLRDMIRDVPGLAGPARIVHPECLRPPRGRQPVEARLGDRDRGAVRRLFQPELDQGGWLCLVIDRGIHR